MTPQHPAAIDGCRYLAAVIIGALQGRPKDELLADRFSPVPGLWDRVPLVPDIDAIAQGSFKHREPPDIRGSGYVVHSLEAALWAFHRADDFREGCLLAAYLGDDADTTAAVYGQVAGAFWGEPGIPASWRERLAMGELIRRFADRLHAFAEGRGDRVLKSGADHPRDPQGE
jgi:ADP-ribosyl-[dinitrogen reductase] hydrolase